MIEVEKQDITVSLLIPCYNAGKFVKNFIEQIHSLTIPFDEVIFYDDNSTDNTLDLLRKTDYKVIAGKENKGPGYARNRLAEAATGDYIHFHDIDDEFHPDYLTNKKHHLPSYDVVICNVDWIHETTRKPLINWHYSDELLISNPIQYTLNNPIGGINGLYRKEIFFLVNGFNENLRCWEDADLHVRLAFIGAKFKVVEQTLCFSLRSGHSLSADQTSCTNCRLKFLESYTTLLPKNNLDSIIIELNKCALYFFYNQEWESFNKCIQIANTFNYLLPLTNNKIIKLLLALGLKQRSAFQLQKMSVNTISLLQNVTRKNQIQANKAL